MIHRGESLVNMILSKPIDGSAITHYLSSFATLYSKDVLSLNTPESILVVFCMDASSVESGSTHASD